MCEGEGGMGEQRMLESLRVAEPVSVARATPGHAEFGFEQSEGVSDRERKG